MDRLRPAVASRARRHAHRRTAREPAHRGRLTRAVARSSPSRSSPSRVGDVGRRTPSTPSHSRPTARTSSARRRAACSSSGSSRRPLLPERATTALALAPPTLAAKLQAHTSTIYSLAFAPGDMLITGSDEEMRGWRWSQLLAGAWRRPSSCATRARAAARRRRPAARDERARGRRGGGAAVLGVGRRQRVRVGPQDALARARVRGARADLLHCLALCPQRRQLFSGSEDARAPAVGRARPQVRPGAPLPTRRRSARPAERRRRRRAAGARAPRSTPTRTGWSRGGATASCARWSARRSRASRACRPPRRRRRCASRRAPAPPCSPSAPRPRSTVEADGRVRDARDDVVAVGVGARHPRHRRRRRAARRDGGRVGRVGPLRRPFAPRDRRPHRRLTLSGRLFEFTVIH